MTQTENLAGSAIFTVIARTAMILATAALPVVGWLLQRSVNTVDEISRKVDTVNEKTVETNSTVKLIQQTQTMQGALIADHEGRIRGLERVPVARPQ